MFTTKQLEAFGLLAMAFSPSFVIMITLYCSLSSLESARHLAVLYIQNCEYDLGSLGIPGVLPQEFPKNHDLAVLVYFMKTSEQKNFARKTASLFRALGQPARLRILVAIGQAEACVCHLEAVLGLRQAYISQHLMALRDSGLVTTRREGKFIFYRLQDPDLIELISNGADLAGVAFPEIPPVGRKKDCGCPSCSTPEVQALPLIGG